MNSGAGKLSLWGRVSELVFGWLRRLLAQDVEELHMKIYQLSDHWQETAKEYKEENGHIRKTLIEQQSTLIDVQGEMTECREDREILHGRCATLEAENVECKETTSNLTAMIKEHQQKVAELESKLA